MRTRLLCGLGLGLLTLGLASPASGHAEVERSSPAAGAVLGSAPDRVALTFEERPDPALSTVQLLDASGPVRGVGKVRGGPGTAHGLWLRVPALSDGRYTVAWRTVSAVDGHLESGEFSFGVNVSAATGHRPSAVPPSWPAVTARLVYYLGVTGLLGMTFVALVVFRPTPERVLRLALWASLVAGVVGALGVAFAQASADGVGLGRLLSSTAGPGTVARVVPLLQAVLAAAAVVTWRGGPRRAALVAVGGYAALSMLADVHASHAAAAPSWAWLHVTVLWAHFLAVGVWIGGLAVVVACLPGMAPARRTRGLARYSAAAAVALFAVAGSGVTQAVAEVGSWATLVSTTFGRLVLMKVGVIAALAALGAVNRYCNLPRLPRSAAPLRRVAVTEVGLAVCALAAAALLPSLSPSERAPAATSEAEVTAPAGSSPG